MMRDFYIEERLKCLISYSNKKQTAHKYSFINTLNTVLKLTGMGWRLMIYRERKKYFSIVKHQASGP